MIVTFSLCALIHFKYNAVFTKLVGGSCKLCIPIYISFEYLEIFARKLHRSKAETIHKFFSESTHVIDTADHYYWSLISIDPGDNKFINCALVANADYIISSDKNFYALKEIDFTKVSCITLEEFMKILETPN